MSAKRIKKQALQKSSSASDLWTPDAGSQGPGWVSEKHVLNMLMQVVTKREEWLAQEGLPLNFQMRDGPGLERERFMKHVKAEYASEPHQLALQKTDAQISNKKVKNGKHSRWGREMQRRLGSKVLWELVSFSGKFSGV